MARRHRYWTARGGRITDELFLPFGLRLLRGHTCTLYRAESYGPIRTSVARALHEMSNRENTVASVMFCPIRCRALTDKTSDVVPEHTRDCHVVQVVSERSLCRLSRRVVAEELASLRMSLEAIARPQGCRVGAKWTLMSMLERVDND